jgi:RNA polymerase sigma-70 factor (ECF subfamily)
MWRGRPTTLGRVDEWTALALAAQGGDQVSFATLVRRSQPDVWRLCAHLAGRNRADDLTQETFLRVWTALPRYRQQASVRTWLLAIARNTAIDGLRAASRRPVGVELVDEPASSAAPDPAGLVTTERLLATLAPDRRLALFLTQILGLSYVEAAAVCEVPVGTIRSRVARARQQMVAALGADDGEAVDDRGAADGADRTAASDLPGT